MTTATTASGDGVRGALLSVLRVVAAFLFMAHGAQKLFGFPASHPMPHMPLMSEFGIAGILETFGGACILIGFLTRPVAFILSGEMAVAYFTVHVHGGFWPILNGGEITVLFCFLYLYLAAAGGGAWSVDRLIASRRNRDDG